MPPKRKASPSHLSESPAKRVTRSTLRPELTETPSRTTRSATKLTEAPSTPTRTPRVIKTYVKDVSARRRRAQKVESLKENEKVGQANSRDEMEVSDDELDTLSPSKTSTKGLDKQSLLNSSTELLIYTTRTRSGKQPEAPIRRPTKHRKFVPSPRPDTPGSESESVTSEPTGRANTATPQQKRRPSPMKPQATNLPRTSPRKRPLATTNDSNVDHTTVRARRTLTQASSPSGQGLISQTRVSRKQTKRRDEDGSPSLSKRQNMAGNSSSALSKATIERPPSPVVSRSTSPANPLRFNGVVFPPVTPNKPRPRPTVTSTISTLSDEPPATQPLVSTKIIDLHSSLRSESELSKRTPIFTPPPLTPKRKVINPSSLINIPRVLPNHLHAYLVAQRRAVLQAIQQPPEVVNNGDDHEHENQDPSTNKVAAEQLTGLLNGTINRDEGNSCLVLGPRGSGKSRLVEQCISSFYEHNPLVIRLSGWTQHSDRLAMREIAYQLSQQTGTSFLPQGTDGSEDARVDDEREDGPPVSESFASAKITPAAHLPSLISLLPTLNRPIIVILDGFDLFTLHPRQALLYCLLDTAQSCRAAVGTKGLAVIGITSRIDTIVHLEKRVKSRFSGRMIRTAPPRTLQGWEAITRVILTSKADEDQTMEDDAAAEWHGIWAAVVEQFLHDTAVQNVWNETFSITRDVRMLTRILLSVVLRLSPSSFSLSAAQFASAAAVQRVRPHFPFLHTLPYPAICLLIASVHADTAGQPVFTFEMLHESFRDQVRASTSAPVQVRGGSIGMVRCSRQVLMIAFEDLISMKAFVPVVAHTQSVAKEFIKYRSVIEREDIKKAVERMSQVNLKKWLTKATQ